MGKLFAGQTAEASQAGQAVGGGIGRGRMLKGYPGRVAGDSFTHCVSTAAINMQAPPTMTA